MGYMHIDNLYKNQSILMFKECYALEKVHGTSAHVGWNEGAVKFFSGGAKYEHFVSLFDSTALAAAFAALGHPVVTVYGEAYGGKIQGMKATYGLDLRFVVFDVKVGETWLDVPDAEDVATKLGLEFVPYARVPTDPGVLDGERDMPSRIAARRGLCGTAEGVVLRPLREMTDKRGSRIIAKHKRAEFSERKSGADTPSAKALDPEKQAVLDAAEKIAGEWVTPTRVEHVMDKMRAALGRQLLSVEDTQPFLERLDEDVAREGAGEFTPSREATRAIRALGARLFHAALRRQKIDLEVA